MDWKSVTRALRVRRPSTVASAASSDSSDDPTLHNLKLQTLKTLFSQPLDSTSDNDGDEQDRAALESFIADLFSKISAIKASYAQLQIAQSPYDPESIQSSDQSIISDLKKLSELKQSYLKNQIFASKPPPPLASQIQEQSNLIKTFQITIKKFESELKSKDSEAAYLQSKLLEFENKNRALDSKLHPTRSLASLDNLHISGFNPNHFLIALRFAVKSIRSFVKVMIKEMDSAGWDLDAAAASIHWMHLKPEHRSFAFESFVCAKMFSNFHSKDFNFRFLEPRSSWNQRQFFEEFSELKSLKAMEICDRKSEFGKFCRGKYVGLVHPKMEATFFAGSDSGRQLAGSEFYNGFMEMAKRVWLLHCLFFSLGSEFNGSIFQVRRGSRFSEVFMECVADPGPGPGPGSPTVGFTVVPGFRVGFTVLQCKVYLL